MLPKWCTPARRARLVDLFVQSQGFCVYGHKPCPIQAHHYEVFIEGLVDEWVADDKVYDAALWQEERRRMHKDRHTKGFGRQFDPVAREVFLEHQPDYYLLGLGVNAFTFQRVALVRVPSSNRTLFVDVSGIEHVKTLSKSKRRKIRRGYIDSPPKEVMTAIDKMCRMVVEKER